MTPSVYRLVADSFQSILKTNVVFVANIDGDALWLKYLASFPPGADPIFKKRTEHDCSTCKNFIRRAGGVISVSNGEVRTVWDAVCTLDHGPYAFVAVSLREAVSAAGIRDIFRVGMNEGSFGAEQTRTFDKETQQVETWNHFYTGEIPRGFRSALPDTDRGNYRTTVQVFERGLVELSAETLWDVPLRSTDGFNLDAVARAASKIVKDATEENFVAVVRTAAHTRMDMALAVVKRVIEVKLADEATAKLRADNKIEREKLLRILAEKQEGKLSDLTEKELQKRIAALEA